MALSLVSNAFLQLSLRGSWFPGQLICWSFPAINKLTISVRNRAIAMSNGKHYPLHFSWSRNLLLVNLCFSVDMKFSIWWVMSSIFLMINQLFNDKNKFLFAECSFKRLGLNFLTTQHFYNLMITHWTRISTTKSKEEVWKVLMGRLLLILLALTPGLLAGYPRGISNNLRQVKH